MLSWRRSKNGQLKKPKLDNARRLGIYFIDPDDRELEEIIKNAGRKLETQWLPPALLCKMSKKSKHGETRGKMISNQDLRVSWKPVNPQECVWRNLNQNTMRTTLQEEGQFTATLQFGFSFFLCLKPWKFLQQKQRWNKDGRKLKRFRRGTKHESETKSEVIDEARKEGRKVHFASLMDLCHLKNAELETKHSKKEVELYSEATLWKMILDLMQYSQHIDHQHHKWRQERSWRSFPDCQVAQDKQQTQYLLVP